MSGQLLSLIPIIVLGIAIFFLIGIEELSKILETDIQKKMNIKNNNNLMSDDEFFKKVEKNQVFLIGSSHMGQVNATEVQKFSNLQNIIYNISQASDTPFQRLDQIDKIIESDPKIILYGISYRDFKFPYDGSLITKDVLDSNEKMDCLKIIMSQFFPENPWYQIRKIIGLDGLNSKKEYLATPNTPFYIYEFQSEPTKDVKDFEGNSIENWNEVNTTLCEIKSLKQFISKTSNNKIKVILLTTPIHQTTLEHLSKSQKDNFEIVKQYFREKYDIKILEFEVKYSSNNNIWKDGDHIASDAKIEVFNRDLAKILDDEQ